MYFFSTLKSLIELPYPNFSYKKEMSPEAPVDDFIKEEKWREILSSLVICFFARGIYQPDLVAMALSFAGFDLHPEDLNRIGDQIYKEKYRFKMLTGFSLDGLRIPKRIFDTPSPNAELKEGYIQRAIAYAKKVIQAG